MTQTKTNPKTEVDKPLSDTELKATSAVAREEQHDGSLAVTPATMGGPQPRLAADIRQILRNKAVQDAQAKAEADFDAEYNADSKDLPATLEEALAVTRVVESEGDLRDLPGFRCASTSAQDNFELVLIRPDTLVENTVDVYDASDLTKRTTLYAGDKVEGAKVGYVPTNYIDDVRRVRLLAGK